ncbi:MAG: hypothetical protein ACREGB_04270 [Candidatus Saccharimonadales bacterium]
MMPTRARQKDRAHPVAVSANGKQVYANLMAMPLAASISSNPHLLRLAEDVILATELKGASMQLEQDMGRSVGRSEIVATTDADVVFYARQSKNAGFTRFVKNRQSASTQFITINLVVDEDGEYEVTNVWVGNSFPAAPDQEDATVESADYWLNHAVIYNGQPMISSTLTKTCPY